MFEDMNWWGVLAMPVGVALCFGPVIVAWALAERNVETPLSRRTDKKDVK